jgi:hypothetical protein
MSRSACRCRRIDAPGRRTPKLPTLRVLGRLDLDEAQLVSASRLGPTALPCLEAVDRSHDDLLVAARRLPEARWPVAPFASHEAIDADMPTRAGSMGPGHLARSSCGRRGGRWRRWRRAAGRPIGADQLPRSSWSTSSKPWNRMGVRQRPKDLLGHVSTGGMLLDSATQYRMRRECRLRSRDQTKGSRLGHRPGGGHACGSGVAAHGQPSEPVQPSHARPNASLPVPREPLDPHSTTGPRTATDETRQPPQRPERGRLRSYTAAFIGSSTRGS